jgi:hypothetical protein
MDKQQELHDQSFNNIKERDFFEKYTANNYR